MDTCRLKLQWICTYSPEKTISAGPGLKYHSSCLAAFAAKDVNSVDESLRDSYSRWESIFEGAVVDQGEMGVQVAEWCVGGVGTGVNIASGLGRAPVPFRPHRKTSLLKRLDRELMTSVDYAA